MLLWWQNEKLEEISWIWLSLILSIIRWNVPLIVRQDTRFSVIEIWKWLEYKTLKYFYCSGYETLQFSIFIKTSYLRYELHMHKESLRFSNVLPDRRTHFTNNLTMGCCCKMWQVNYSKITLKHISWLIVTSASIVIHVNCRVTLLPIVKTFFILNIEYCEPWHLIV